MKLLFIAVVMALPVIAFAQPNYQQGYVLKNNGDTLKGFINYREWAYSPLKVDFKTNRTDNAAQEFNPNTIQGFGINGSETYTSYVGLLSKNKNVFPDIPSSLDTARQTVAIFLKLLATGDHIALYLNSEIAKNKFFIAEKGTPPVELKYFEYYAASGGDEAVDNLFRGQLLLYAYKFNNGDKKITSDIERVKFEEQDLEDIVDKINKVNPAAAGAYSSRNKAKLRTRFFGGAGINSIQNNYGIYGFTSVIINNQTFVTPAYISSHSNTVGPKFDLGIDLFINPDIQQFVFRGELAFSTFGGQVREAATASFPGVDLSYSGSYLTLTPQFLFSIYNKEKFKIYADAGCGLYMASYSNNKNGSGQSNQSGYSTNMYFPLQAGVILNKKYEVSVTYTSFSTGNTYSSVVVVNKLAMNVGFKVFFN